MAYFPNGTANEMYVAEYCSKCAHTRAEKGCPVMLVHLLFNYGQFDEGEEKVEQILSILIPKSKLENKKCRMFIKNGLRETVECPSCHGEKEHMLGATMEGPKLQKCGLCDGTGRRVKS